MSTIDDVLERLIGDADFRTALARDPGAALAEYDLDRDQMELLASRLDQGDDGERTVEQRTSKSAMLSFLSSLGGGGGGSARAVPDSFFDIDYGAEAASGEKGGTADMNIGIGELQEGRGRGGHVEASWKVEEGEAGVAPIGDYQDDHPPSGSAAPGTELDDIGAPKQEQAAVSGYMKLGDIEGESNRSGKVFPKVEIDVTAAGDEEAAAGGYLKIGDIKGESERSGAVFPKVEIDVTAAGDEETASSTAFLKIEGVPGESTKEVPTESIALNFTKIQASAEPAPGPDAVEDFLQIDDA